MNEVFSKNVGAQSKKLLKGEFWLLCGILLLAIVVRLAGIGHKNLWMDEIIALVRSTGRDLACGELPRGRLIETPPDLTNLGSARPWWLIWTYSTCDTHPPLYFVMLRFWRELFGEGDVAARSLSTAWSLIAIALTFLTTRIRHGPFPAAWASLFMAIGVPQIAYAQEARNYTMVTGLGLANLLLVLRLETYGLSVPGMLALSIGLVAMLLTHYFSIPIFVALAVYVMARFRPETRRWVLTPFAIVCHSVGSLAHHAVANLQQADLAE